MSSEPSKRGKIRKFFEEIGDLSKRPRQSHSPVPSGLGAHHLDMSSSTPIPSGSTIVNPIMLPGNLAPLSSAGVAPIADETIPIMSSHSETSATNVTHHSNTLVLNHVPELANKPTDLALPVPSYTSLLPQSEVASQEIPQAPTATEPSPDRTAAVLTPASKQLTRDIASAALKASVDGLRKSANVIPGFKPCLDVLADCIGSVPAATKNKQDYETLALSIAAAMDGLGKHLNRNGTTDVMNRLVTDVIENLDRMAEHVKRKQERTRAQGYLSSERDIDDIIECYREVDMVFQQLQSTRLKELNPAKTAKYSSGAASQIRRECTPGTRRLVLQELQDWLMDPDGTKIHWMNGMAGTGKSTIAYSFCRSLDKTRWPCASFFCSRSLPECRDELRIVPTLAYQLAYFLPAYQDALCHVLDRDPDVGNCSIREQFKRLVKDPLLELQGMSLAGPLVMVIDALDECSSPSAASSVLDALLRFVKDLPIRFFVTCRPDPGVLQQLPLAGGALRSLCHLHDVEASLVQADIGAYIRAELEPVGVPALQIRRLTERSGRLFIYAATAVRYVQAKSISVDHQERVDIILGTGSRSSGKALEPMDALYTTILSAALENSELESWDKEDIELLLHTVMCAMEPLTIDALAHLMKFKSPGHAQRAAEPLRSVLNVDETSGLVSPLHASFPDYMLTQSRSGRFFCDKIYQNKLLALRCFETMTRRLRFNICNLESSFLLDDDVPDLPARVQQCIPRHLRYACWYWDKHEAFAKDATETLSRFEEFLTRYALFWLEVMNLTYPRSSSRSSCSRDRYDLEGRYKWMKLSTHVPDHLEILYRDVMKFVKTFGQDSVSKSTPHIYVSALALWDRAAPVWMHHGTRMIRPVHATGLGTSYRKSTVRLSSRYLASTLRVPTCIPHNGRRVACALRGGDFHIRDVADMKKENTIRCSGHDATVYSLAFSPDGLQITSGSHDKTIRVWNAHNGTLIAGPFEGHTDSVRSVTFSPDGRYVASGSRDRTIRVWDAQTGSAVGNPFQGHTRIVWSVAYSPDGNRIASGSGDHTICVWDVCTGRIIVGPLSGHTDGVRSVAYSPDGTSIASGSDDRTIHVWNSWTGDLLINWFMGHTGHVRSVAYSPDGDRIVSNSSDGTVCIWNAQTREIVAGPFDEDSAFVASTSSGERIIFCSSRVTGCDLNLCISTWNTQPGLILSQAPRGHAAAVASLAFSDDSSRIVCVSTDDVVCVWDAKTGNMTAGPFNQYSCASLGSFLESSSRITFLPGGNYVALFVGDRARRPVYVLDVHTGSTVAQWSPILDENSRTCSASFSPDGSHMAAGYNDGTTNIWNTIDGTVASGPIRVGEENTEIASVTYSPAGDRIVYLVSAPIPMGYSFRVLDCRTKRILAFPFYEDATYKVLSIACSPDSRHMVSGSADHAIRIHDAHTRQLILGPLMGHKDSVSRVAYSPDGRSIVSYALDGTIYVWDAHTGQATAGPFRVHPGRLTSVVFSPDSRLFATGSKDCAIRVWDLQMCSSGMPPSLEGLAFEEEGWVIGEDSARLLWVPEEFRARIIWPRNIAVIHREGSVKWNFTDALIGTRWAECFK
ncbi:hypothetical protein FRC07_000960 [Ceratobasidium sp. 392]|nr:hypothetical protein FRC07_000960 [Ceratobasidium sp. 392]